MDNAVLIKQTVSEVIDILKAKNVFIEDCYFYKDYHRFMEDVEMAINNQWKLSKTRDKYQDLAAFVEHVAIAFDRYALELYELLLPHDMSRPHTCPLYRTAQSTISRYDRLGAVFSAEDALSAALNRVMANNLSILNFKGESTLKTWVIGVLNNVIKEQARREGIIGHRNVPDPIPGDKQVFDQGPSIFDSYSEDSSDQPEEVQKHIHWLQCRLQFLSGLIEKGKIQKPRSDNLSFPMLEQAWILWNDFYADFYIEYTEHLGSNDHEFSTINFEIFTMEKKNPDKKGGHNPSYTDYLAREIGRIRQWSPRLIEKDLSLPRTPKDKSQLRLAVRTRRNEGKKKVIKFDLKVKLK